MGRTSFFIGILGSLMAVVFGTVPAHADLLLNPSLAPWMVSTSRNLEDGTWAYLYQIHDPMRTMPVVRDPESQRRHPRDSSEC
jgi:hypothetical protein